MNLELWPHYISYTKSLRLLTLRLGLRLQYSKVEGWKFYKRLLRKLWKHQVRIGEYCLQKCQDKWILRDLNLLGRVWKLEELDFRGEMLEWRIERFEKVIRGALERIKDVQVGVLQSILLRERFGIYRKQREDAYWVFGMNFQDEMLLKLGQRGLWILYEIEFRNFAQSKSRCSLKTSNWSDCVKLIQQRCMKMAEAKYHPVNEIKNVNQLFELLKWIKQEFFALNNYRMMVEKRILKESFVQYEMDGYCYVPPNSGSEFSIPIYDTVVELSLIQLLKYPEAEQMLLYFESYQATGIDSRVILFLHGNYHIKWKNISSYAYQKCKRLLNWTIPPEMREEMTGRFKSFHHELLGKLPEDVAYQTIFQWYIVDYLLDLFQTQCQKNEPKKLISWKTCSMSHYYFASCLYLKFINPKKYPGTNLYECNDEEFFQETIETIFSTLLPHNLSSKNILDFLHWYQCNSFPDQPKRFLSFLLYMQNPIHPTPEMFQMLWVFKQFQSSFPSSKVSLVTNTVNLQDAPQMDPKPENPEPKPKNPEPKPKNPEPKPKNPEPENKLHTK